MSAEHRCTHTSASVDSALAVAKAGIALKQQGSLLSDRQQVAMISWCQWCRGIWKASA